MQRYYNKQSRYSLCYNKVIGLQRYFRLNYLKIFKNK